MHFDQVARRSALRHTLPGLLTGAACQYQLQGNGEHLLHLRNGALVWLRQPARSQELRSLLILQPILPLQWPTSPEIPESPEKRYRSAYIYPSQADVAGANKLPAWKDLSNLDLLLRLVSYSFDRERQRYKWRCDQACLRGKEP